MTIQWFPGHMAKAKREVEESLPRVDFVIELLDARAPSSSQNPLLQDMLQQKPKLIVMMKKDLADDQLTNRWLRHFHDKGFSAIAIDVSDSNDIKQVMQKAKELARPIRDKAQAKGINPRLSRAMILGIPNVGKSTLINRLAHKKIAQIGDKPGVTTKQQWLKIRNEFELLDTSGILWPKFQDEAVSYRLAALGTIKDHLLPLEDVAAFAIQYIQTYFPEQLEKRYGLSFDTDDMWEIFVSIGNKRGALESGGHVNIEKVAALVLNDLRAGKLGSITWEAPPDSA